MSGLKSASTAELLAEIQTRGAMPRCRCRKWNTYLGMYDADGNTLRCFGCLRAVARCTCG